uniref:LCIB_C_CA domain-containing protein n=1 Tax=Rodentolepis nana TaxID=102285 RepID=A0A0R3TVE8_RODNA
LIIELQSDMSVIMINLSLIGNIINFSAHGITLASRNARSHRRTKIICSRDVVGGGELVITLEVPADTNGMDFNERLDWKLNDFGNDIKDVVIEALTIYTDPKRIAEHIKTCADTLYGGPHHCIVGKNFCGYATQEKWMQCRMGDLKVYLYKSPRWA